MYSDTGLIYVKIEDCIEFVSAPTQSVGCFNEKKQFSLIRPLNHTTKIIRNDYGYCGLINTENYTLLTPIRYDDISDFNNGIAFVERNGKYGLIKLDGQRTIIKYDHIQRVQGNFFICKTNKKFSILTSNLVSFNTTNYDDIQFLGNTFLVKRSGLYGLISINKQSTAIKYESITHAGNNFFILTLNNKHYILTPQFKLFDNKAFYDEVELKRENCVKTVQHHPNGDLIKYLEFSKKGVEVFY